MTNKNASKLEDSYEVTQAALHIDIKSSRIKKQQV